MQAAPTTLPGLHPVIVRAGPRLGGKNNFGVGYDGQGTGYLLKPGGAPGVAEFVGAAVCHAAGVPCYGTRVVERRTLRGPELVVGCVLIEKAHRFDQTDVSEWHKKLAGLLNPEAFSCALAVDLCLGNDDRHQDNWLFAWDHNKDAPPFQAHAIDFGWAWPMRHPPPHPHRHPERNTWNFVRDWRLVGIQFDRTAFHRTCATIGSLDTAWLCGVIDPLVGVWLTADQRDAAATWWESHWKDQVVDAIYALETDGDWM